jgi:hypothetical protein
MSPPAVAVPPNGPEQLQIAPILIGVPDGATAPELTGDELLDALLVPALLGA